MPTMTKIDCPLEVLIQELKIVMKQIEENPTTSSWAIRMALKALIERTERKMEETI